MVGRSHSYIKGTVPESA